MARVVLYSHLTDWPAEADILSAAGNLSGYAEQMAADGRQFRDQIRSMASAYYGPSSLELADSGQGVAAFAEAVRAMTTLVVTEMDVFAARRERLEDDRARAETLAVDYNAGAPVNRFWEYYEALTEAGPSDPNFPQFPYPPWDGRTRGALLREVLAEEPFDQAAMQAQSPSEIVLLSGWRTTPGLENRTARHAVPGRALQDSPSYLEVLTQVQAVWQEYSDHVTHFCDKIAGINIHSSDFRDEFSSGDSWRDGGLFGLLGELLGPGADRFDNPPNGPRGTDGATRGQRPSKPFIPDGKAGGVLVLFDIVITYLDEFQDSRSRVQIEHPEWDANEKGWNAFWRTVVRGTIRGMVDFGFGVIPGGSLIGFGEVHNGDYNKGSIDFGEIVADWIWE